MKKLFLIIAIATFTSCGNGGNETATDTTSSDERSSALRMDTDSSGAVRLAPGQNGTDAPVEGINASGK